jgi:hypothetical protein
MMEGIDASFSGVVFIGAAQPTRNRRSGPYGPMAIGIRDRVNGVSVRDWNAIAGHFGVPVAAISAAIRPSVGSRRHGRADRTAVVSGWLKDLRRHGGDAASEAS